MITKGDQVLGWQKMLSEAGYNPGPADGIFGPKVTAATKAFQAENALSQSGRVDTATYQAMQNRLTGRTLPTQSIFGGLLANKGLLILGIALAGVYIAQSKVNRKPHG